MCVCERERGTETKEKESYTYTICGVCQTGARTGKEEQVQSARKRLRQGEESDISARTRNQRDTSYRRPCVDVHLGLRHQEANTLQVSLLHGLSQRCLFQLADT